MGNNRKLILINRPFQLKFCFFIATLVFVSSLIYPGIIYSILEKSLPPQVFQQNIWMILGVLSTLQFVFVGLVFIISMFQSHKIAGPLYKLNKTLLDVSMGHKIRPVTFRSGDHFPELADSYNKAILKISEGHREDFARISEVSSFIQNLGMVVPEDKKNIIAKIVSELNEIQKKFE